MDAGGFQRLQESPRQAQRHAVPDPELLSPAGGEAQQAGRRDRLAFERSQKRPGGGLIVDVPAAIDVAVADAVLQGDAPLPARLPRGGQGIGGGGPIALRLHGHGAIAGQPLTPVLVTGPKSLLDQQSAKTAAVDEKVARDRPAVLQPQGFDVPRFALQVRARDLRVDPGDATFQGVFPQELGKERGVEVQGVGDLGQR